MNQEVDFLLNGTPKEFEFPATTIREQLLSVNARMLGIERENMAYNKATDFGNKPNGQEAYIEHILAEWDHLAIRRERLKEMIRPTTVVYLPSARTNMEDMLAPSDDTNHPNYRGN